MRTLFLNLPGGRIAYDDSGGDGPLVICVPGLGDLRGLYRFLAPQLVAQGYRVITMDVRGHGESSVDWPDWSAAAVGSDVVALIQRLNGGPAILIGQSMAAAAAVWAAAEVPDLVSGIVLCGPFVRDVPMGALVRLGAALVVRSASLWSMYYASLYRAAKPADFADYRTALRANLRQPGRLTALRGMMRASKAACEARIDQVRCPALVVMGSADPDFADPTAEARMVAERLHGQLLLVEGAGHYPQAELPARTNEAIGQFVAKAAAGG
ncbi:MAG TPA: alpha/beta hydrolase [Micromonosporaceae bacterium]